MEYDKEETGKIIRSARVNRNWTQKKLGDKLYMSGKQISNYEQGKLMPSTEILMKLCEVFDCELGYLLGEEDYSDGTRIQTAICEATGLSSASISIIQKLTGIDHDCVKFGHQSKKFRRILESLFTSQMFIYFIECVGDLDDRIMMFKDIDKQLNEKIGASLYKKAFNYYNSTTDYKHDPNAEVLEPELQNAMLLIGKAIDQKNDLSYQIKVARYELREYFERLTYSIYPKTHG